MKRINSKVLLAILLLLCTLVFYQNRPVLNQKTKEESNLAIEKSYWFELHRKSKKELLFQGVPGSKQQSSLVKTFDVNTGVSGKRPTPLPRLMGLEYWVVTSKQETPDNLETAPYFLTLNVPVSEQEPFGPVPYEECDGQCNWVLPGSFGLHGVAGNEAKLVDEGSSGCIRHSDGDITYLYNLLDPEKEEIRYYIEDI